MKKIYFLLLTCCTILLLCSCGGSRKIYSNGYGGRVVGEVNYNQIGKPTKGQSTTASSSSSSQSSTSSATLSSAEEKKLGMTITSKDNKKLYKEIAGWIGTPYKYGGSSKSGTDCSGFVYSIYQAVYGKTLTRQSSGMLTNNCNKINKSDLKEGDLLFFRTDGKKSTTPNHVAIYLKDNKFAHASSSKGVVIANLTDSYYIKTWLTGGRVK